MRADSEVPASEAAFNDIVGGIDSLVWIVTASSGPERSGCLVGFASQCSIDPARFVVWISRNNHTYPVANTARAVAVHLLRRDAHGLARLFGEATGDEIDKFARCQWHDGPGGVPILEGCDWFVGTIVQTVDGGDHVGFLLDPFAAGRHNSDEPHLGLQDVLDLSPGHEA